MWFLYCQVPKPSPAVAQKKPLNGKKDSSDSDSDSDSDEPQAKLKQNGSAQVARSYLIINE